MVRRMHSILLLFALLIGSAGMNYVQAEVYSGSCGTNAAWSLNTETAILVISGTGAIDDYTYTNQIPWYSYRSSIIGVSISNGITRIGKATCYNCFNLTSVSMGTGVTSIGTSAFYGCSKLPSITIGNHVTTIEQSAFYNCSALKSITIPPSVTSIGTNAFMGCWAMESVYITDLAAWCHINFSSYTSSPFYRNTRNDVAHGGGNLYVNGTKVTTLRIPDGITEIPHRAFFGFMGITSIQFNQATTIGNHAFGACHGLTSLTFPEGVTAINYNTFGFCTQLQTIYLPASLTTFGDYVWWNCDALTDIYVSWTENIPSLSTSITDKYPQSDITLHVPCGTAALYQAAEDWQDYTIVEERGHGTCGAEGKNLTWSLSCDGTLTISGSGAMADWSSSDKVPWYSYRSSITTVNIRDGVTSIGNRAFIECTALTSVTIPNSVTSINNNAFFSCSALANIAIPNSVTTIGQYVFYGCSALTNITIPNSVTSLGENTFRNCSALTDMYVSWIGTDILELPTNITNNDPQSDITLHVPCSAMSLYKAAEGWKDYTIEGEGGPYTITVESDDPTMGTVDAIKIDN